MFLRHNVVRIFFLCFLAFYSLHASASADFLHFASWDEAQQYYTKRSADLARENGGKPHRVLAHTHPNYSRVEKTVATLTEGFAQYFAAVASQGGPPFVLIIDDDSPNAYAMRDLTTDKNPYVFIIHEGLLTVPDDQLTGVIAHELTHLFIQYVSNGRAVPRERYYLRNSKEVAFGPTLPDDPEVEENLARIQSLYEDVGSFTNPELLGMPFNLKDDESTYSGALRFLFSKYSSKKECRNIFSEFRDFEMFIYSRSSEGFKLILKNEHEKSVVIKAVSGFETKVRACLAGIKENYDEVVMMAFEIPKEEYLDWISSFGATSRAEHDRIAKAFASSDAIDVIWSEVQNGRSELRKIQGPVDQNKIGLFTYEDGADEMAIYIMSQLGLNANGLNLFLQAKAGGDSCDLTEEPEEYDGLDNPYHHICWRVYRNRKFQEYVENLSLTQRNALYGDRLWPTWSRQSHFVMQTRGFLLELLKRKGRFRTMNFPVSSAAMEYLKSIPFVCQSSFGLWTPKTFWDRYLVKTKNRRKP